MEKPQRFDELPVAAALLRGALETYRARIQVCDTVEGTLRLTQELREHWKMVTQVGNEASARHDALLTNPAQDLLETRR
jgi:hypothetical protein